MIPPLVSFVTWNRMGLTIRNLNALLGTHDDFELHIIDNNSQDDTWDFVQEIKDQRIKSRTRFDINRGHIYATNFNLYRRKKDQYFITLDNDVNIHTPNWITRFLQVFELFPDTGLLGAVTQEYYNRYNQPMVKHEKNNINYLQITRGFVEGCCQCLRPELLNILGYWNEENCMGDMELCYRICNFTPFKAGFLPAVEIDQVQHISCEQCRGRDWCSLLPRGKNCFDIRDQKYKNPTFRNLNQWKYDLYLSEINSGKRSAFCPSIHDVQSIRNHYYNRKMAEDNFCYYKENSN